MASPNKPQVGEWYQTPNGGKFEIVAVNEYDQTVDIQHFGGEVEELEMEAWNDQELVNINAPEDWSGPFDDLVADDFGDVETAIHPENWGGYLDELDRDK